MITKYIRRNRGDAISRIFFLCWLVYFTSYIGRLNFSSSMTKIIEIKILTGTQAGLINMAYFCAYGIGQISNGLIGDKSHPRIQIFVGLLGSGIFNLVMAFGNPVLMTVFWCLNGYFQSMLWPPMMRIFSEKFPEDRKAKAGVDIVTSMSLGSLCSYLISAAALWAGRWQNAFYIPGVLLLAVAFLWLFRFGKEESRLSEKETGAEKTHREKKSAANESLREIFFTEGVALILLPVIIHGTLKDGVTSWIPTFFHERFLVSPAFAVAVTMILPIVNMFGAYAAGFVNRKLKNCEIKSASVFFLTATVSLVLIQFAGSCNVILTGFLFASVTLSMMAVNTLFVNLIPLHFGKTGKVSAISGILNAAAYFGSAVSSFQIGLTAEKSGWNTVTFIWILETLAALVFCCMIRNKTFVMKKE